MIRTKKIASWELIEAMKTFGVEETPMLNEAVIRQSEPTTTMRMLTDGPDPVMILCSSNMWPGVSEIWTVVLDRERLAKKAKASVREIRLQLKHLMASNRLHRCQALAVLYRDVKFARILGFEVEGILRNYGPNRESYYRLAVINE